jgi:hypothetical protein
MYGRLNTAPDIKSAISNCKSDRDRLDVAERITYINWCYLPDLAKQCADESIKQQIMHIARLLYHQEEYACYGEC